MNKLSSRFEANVILDKEARKWASRTVQCTKTIQEKSKALRAVQAVSDTYAKVRLEMILGSLHLDWQQMQAKKIWLLTSCVDASLGVRQEVVHAALFQILHFYKSCVFG